MITITEKDVMNFKGAFRGLRNPLESHFKSDSIGDIAYFDEKHEMMAEVAESYTDALVERTDVTVCAERDKRLDWFMDNSDLESGSNNDYSSFFLLGLNDLILAQRMISGGKDESKFMRQIFVSMDIDAPLYFWKEMDQYRIGCTTNSESTMHKLATTPITRECFSFDNAFNDLPINKIDQSGVTKYGKDMGYVDHWHFEDGIDAIITHCEELRQEYLRTKDKAYWRAMIQLLPASWNQKRTWSANYAVLRNIYFARKSHKLQEWRDFCDMILTLPYAHELIAYEKEVK